MVAGLFIWAAVIGNGAGYSVGEIFTSNIPGGAMPDKGPVYLFLLGLTGNIAFWATMALNIPDFSRYAKSQKTQFRGQMYGMLPGMAFCAIVGAFFAQATQLAYETTIWNPVGVLGVIWSDSTPVYVLTFVLGIGIVIATLTTNIAANIVAPANGFSNLAPKKISYKLGTLIACLVAAAYLVPFTLSANFVGFMWTFMNVYGGFLAPLASIFILDYYFIKKRNIDIASLFRLNGRYFYKGGFNVHAIIAWVGGAILPTLISLIPSLQAVTALSWINANAYLFAFIVSLIIYALIMPRNHESVISDEEEKAMTEIVAS
jgi:NCS1 family nucleobase:cation symporter-1